MGIGFQSYGDRSINWWSFHLFDSDLEEGMYNWKE